MGVPTPQKFLCDPLLPELFPFVVYGAGGSAKSLLAVKLALIHTLTRGGYWLGYPVVGGGRSLFVDFELNEDVFNRRTRQVARGLGYTHAEIAGLGYYEVGAQKIEDAFNEVIKLVEEHSFSLVVIDSVGLAIQGDMGMASDVIQWYRSRILPLIELGATPALVDHQARSYSDEEYQSKGSFGSVYKENTVRSILQVQPRASEEGSDLLQVRARHKKASFGPRVKPFDVEIEFSESTIRFNRVELEKGDLLDEQSLSLEDRVVWCVMEHGAGTISTIAERLDKKTGSVGNACRTAFKEGRLIKAGREGNADVYGLPEVEGGEDEDPRPDDPDERQAVAPGAASINGKVIETDVELDELVRLLAGDDEVAFDLETVPPDGWEKDLTPKGGWLADLIRPYRKWRRGLKKKPSLERQLKRWEKEKKALDERVQKQAVKVRKKYATDPDTAVDRVVSLAASSINVLVDTQKVDPSSLLSTLKDKTLITHNGSFDLGVLRRRYGYVHQSRILDTQLLYVLHHYAEDGERSKVASGKRRLPDPYTTKIDFYGRCKADTGMTSLAVLVDKYLGEELSKDEQGGDWSTPKLSEEQVAYALKDSSILIDLSRAIARRLEKINMDKIVELETQVFPAQVDMELNGFPADREIAEQMSAKYLAESEEALARLNALLPQDRNSEGLPWNWDRNEDIREVLRLLGVGPTLDSKGYKKTDNTKEPSTAKDALATIKEPPAAKAWVDAYLEYHAVHKQYRDFAGQYVGLIEDGVIRGSFYTISTGRYSCRRPNLQQVPKRGELQSKKELRIRSIFRPPAGEKFIVADFAQVELLLAATIAARVTRQHGHMLEVFKAGETDIHTETAGGITGKDPGIITRDERTLAKAANFGLLYGARAETLMEYARNSYGIEDMTLADARRYRDAFFKRYPELAAWHRIVERDCSRGVDHSTTPLGRRRKLPKWVNSGEVADTTAKNHPVQGAGGDAIRSALARLFADRHDCPGNPKLRCTVHDEVVLSVDEENAGAAKTWVEGHMAAAVREAIGDPESPIVVDVDVKDSWA